MGVKRRKTPMLFCRGCGERATSRRGGMPACKRCATKLTPHKWESAVMEWDRIQAEERRAA